jgi:hypothetical protein
MSIINTLALLGFVFLLYSSLEEFNIFRGAKMHSIILKYLIEFLVRWFVFILTLKVVFDSQRNELHIL